jgi:hypothetical protein
VSTPLDRLRAARKIYMDMLAENPSTGERSILQMNIAALDLKITTLAKQAGK